MARPFRRLYESHSSFCRKLDTGYPLSPWLGNDKGDLATSVMPLKLPYCSAREEKSKKRKRKLLRFRNHACGGIFGGERICDLLSLRTADSSSTLLEKRCGTIGSSPILQTGAEDALHCVAEKRC